VEKEKQKILVTGATGFVGSAVIKELGKYEEYEICGLAGKGKITETTGQKLPENIFRCDITDLETLPKAGELKKTDVLIHTAGLAHQFGSVKKKDFWRVNVLGTENICQLAREIGVEHFILISSVSVYGDYGKKIIDEAFDCQPSGFYAESKLESERRARDSCEKNDIPLTILRLATVIGEGDRGNTMRLITAMDKKRFFWIGDGGNKKSLIYKSDVAEAILEIIQKKRESGTEVFNLTAEAVTMKEIVEAIACVLGKKIPRIRIPEATARGIFGFNRMGFSFEYLKNLEQALRKWLSNDIFSGDKFYERYGFKPKTPVAEALARQVGFYLNQKGEKS
jgi:nucleoside-diphosphate-sugar epimerase